MRLKFSEFGLPPVKDALVLGRLAPMGARAVHQALSDMAPGAYRLIQIDHPIIEAVVVRESDLRKIPEKDLLDLIVRHAERIMDETESLHVMLEIEVLAEEEILVSEERSRET